MWSLQEHWSTSTRGWPWAENHSCTISSTWWLPIKWSARYISSSQTSDYSVRLINTNDTSCRSVGRCPCSYWCNCSSIVFPPQTTRLQQWDSQCWLKYRGPKIHNGFGVFTYAGPLHQSRFLPSNGAAESSLDSSPQLHLKNANSNFTYIDCSYGIGSLIGFEENDRSVSEGFLSYQLLEVGYLFQTQCTISILPLALNSYNSQTIQRYLKSQNVLNFILLAISDITFRKLRG